MTDGQGRTMTREYPEEMLLGKLAQCTSLQSIFHLCTFTLGELGYRKFAKAAEFRLEEASKAAKAKAEQAVEDEIGKPRKPLRSLKDDKP